MAEIQGKVAIVTGAGRGIGRAVAIELARQGARVGLAARTVSELEETERLASGSRGLATDVRSREAVERLFSEVEGAFGPVQILVNAAGLGIFGPVANFKDEDFDTIMDTNLKGMFFACRRALPSMMAKRSGDIVNIASIAGKVGSATRAVYCASKFGVVGFTESLAEEVREYGIRASVICPGSTHTDFSPGSKNDKARERMLAPSDVAQAVRMILEQEPNSFISQIVMRPTQKP